MLFQGSALWTRAGVVLDSWLRSEVCWGTSDEPEPTVRPAGWRCCFLLLLPLPAAVSALQGTYLQLQIWLAPVPLGPAVRQCLRFQLKTPV